MLSILYFRKIPFVICVKGRPDSEAVRAEVESEAVRAEQKTHEKSTVRERRWSTNGKWVLQQQFSLSCRLLSFFFSLSELKEEKKFLRTVQLKASVAHASHLAVSLVGRSHSARLVEIRQLTSKLTRRREDSSAADARHLLHHEKDEDCAVPAKGERRTRLPPTPATSCIISSGDKVNAVPTVSLWYLFVDLNFFF